MSALTPSDPGRRDVQRAHDKGACSVTGNGHGHSPFVVASTPLRLMQTDAATVTAGDITIDSNHENADQITLAFADDPQPAEVSPPAVSAQEETPTPDETSGEDAPAPLDSETVAKARRRDPRAAVQSAIAKQRDAERRADAAEAQVAVLSKPAAREEPVAATPDWARYKSMAASPKADQFENYDDYTAALATFVTDARQHDYETRRQQYYQEQTQHESQAAHAAQWQERLAKARAETPDLDETFDPDVPMSLPMQYLAMESPKGIEILQWLSAHPDDSQRLSTLHPVEVYREMGKLEERLSAASAPLGGPARVISHAKPPIQPLGSSPHTPDATDVTDDLSFDEHFKRMNAADRKRGLL